MPSDDDDNLPPGDQLPQGPSVELAAELAEVRDEARALIEVLTKSHHTNQSLPPDFPREPLIDVAKSLMQLRDAETEGIEVVLGYARLRLTAVRRRHIAPSERPDRPEPTTQAPGRGSVLDNKLALLIAAVSTALDQLKRGELKDDPDERDPGIEIVGDRGVTALNESTAGLQSTLDEGAAELKTGKVNDSKLADAAARSTESASAILRAARAETRMPEVVPSWLFRLSHGLKRSAPAIRKVLPYLRVGIDISQKVAQYFGGIFQRFGKAAEDFIFDEIRHAVDGFEQFLTEIQGDPSLPPPPPGFDIKKVHEMILAGAAPPRTWTPWIDKLDFKGENIPNLKLLSGLRALQSLNLGRTGVSDVTALSGLNALRRLHLSDTLVSDLSTLSRLTALQELSLWNTPISDVSALASLVKLRRLDLTRTLVSDAFALSGLTELQSLGLGATQVRDVSSLSGLVALQSLGLGRTPLNDVSALSSLTELQSLDLEHTHVKDVTALSSLTALQSLNLGRTPVRDISALSALAALQTLYLGGTKVTSLAPLAELKFLTVVYVDGAQLDALKNTLPRASGIVKALDQ
jgi:hypothetical protein